MYRHCFKRVIDFCVALIALICISPILLTVTIWLHFANKGAGAFFLQERPGKDAKIFKIIKFKTMTDERDANGRLLPDEAMRTRMAQEARPMIASRFERGFVQQCQINFYKEILL